MASLLARHDRKSCSQGRYIGQTKREAQILALCVSGRSIIGRAAYDRGDVRTVRHDQRALSGAIVLTERPREPDQEKGGNLTENCRIL